MNCSYSTDKIFDSWIRDLGFNPAYIKNWLASWSNNKKLSSKADAISWYSLQKKKKKKKEANTW